MDICLLLNMHLSSIVPCYRHRTEIEGFICNRAAHWFAIRKINDRYYNLNSTLDRPEIISHFKLAAEMEALQAAGYSVFCVLEPLPPPCSSEAQMDMGLPQYWWKEEDLLSGKTNAMTRANDPWKDVGSGRRLDGGSSSAGIGGGGNNDLSGLSEEEMLAMAMSASLEQHAAPTTKSERSYELTDEPADGTPGTCKIQFRLPDGTRQVRRFLETDLVGVIYAFVSSKCSKQSVELRSGFPPKDISEKKESTIQQANLAGEMIQGRYV